MRFFDFVLKYRGVFFWISWIYIFLCCALTLIPEWPPIITGILILPVNAVTWPIAVKTFKSDDHNALFRSVRYALFWLPIISAILPVAAFIGFLNIL